MCIPSMGHLGFAFGQHYINFMTKLFEPTKTKYSKYFRARARLRVASALTLSEGLKLSLKVSTFGFITAVQLVAVRAAIMKQIKKDGKCRFFIFPHQMKTKRPDQGRMGKGKGSAKIWGCYIRPGTIVCEIRSSNSAATLRALRSAQHRLAIKTVIF